MHDTCGLWDFHLSLYFFFYIMWNSCQVTQGGSVWWTLRRSYLEVETKANKRRSSWAADITHRGIMSDGHGHIHSLFVSSSVLQYRCDPMVALFPHSFFFLDNAGVGLMSCFLQGNENTPHQIYRQKRKERDTSATGYLETLHSLLSSRWRFKDILALFVVLHVALIANQSRGKKFPHEKKLRKKNKAHLFDRRLPPHIWSHPPTCGIEEEDLSKLRSWEVYFDGMP